jgi:hypothetical protein
MSVPGVDISCDQCGYHGSTVVVFGIFKYSTPRGTISLPRTLGWCSSCDSVSPIEDDSREMRIKSLVADLEYAKDKINREKKELLRKTPLLTRIFSTKEPYSESLIYLQEQAVWISSEMTVPVILSEYLGCSRKVRCLTCGSSQVRRFPKLPEGLNDFYDNHRIKLPIGMKHPGCGGDLFASTSKIRLSIHFKDRIYSLNGERIA